MKTNIEFKRVIESPNAKLTADTEKQIFFPSLDSAKVKRKKGRNK